MKTSLMRQAAVCRAALTSLPGRATFRASPAAALALPRSSATFYRPSTFLIRFYATEQAAPSRESNPEPPTLITRFEDLHTLGVNERLIQSITKGMRYETMTEVQSMTINPALRGKDV